MPSVSAGGAGHRRPLAIVHQRDVLRDRLRMGALHAVGDPGCQERLRRAIGAERR
jgi:hypothetical protein